MANELKMPTKDLLTLFDASEIATYKCLNGIECKFYIKIYSPFELEEIAQKNS